MAEWLLCLLQLKRPKKRVHLAATILTADTLEATTRKFNNLFVFQPELREVAMNGNKYRNSSARLPPKLEAFVKRIARLQQADVRDSERTNKTISLLVDRAPNIGDNLLSSRVTLKHFLGETDASHGLQGARWSKFKPVAEGLKNLRLLNGGGRAGWWLILANHSSRCVCSTQRREILLVYRHQHEHQI